MRMIHRRFLLVALVVALASIDAMAQKIVKETLVSEGKKRAYYIYVPKSVQPSSPAPLVVLLHGSNRVGLSLAEKWDGLANKEGVIIVAPDSAQSSHWSVPGDGPAFLHELVEAVKAKHPINPKRVYLFGHSGGAIFALLMSLYESEYFAATAVHAGALKPETSSLMDLAKRKIPIQIQVGSEDPFFPVTDVRATRDSLNSRGFSVQLIEIPRHTHWYYDRSSKINQSAWEFLKTHELATEPRFAEYKFRSDEPTSHEAAEQYNKGLEHHRAGNMAAAIAAYTRAIQIDGKSADAYNNRGVAHMALKDDVAALADFTRSLELAPSDSAYNNRGSILFSKQKVEEAIADFSAGIKLKPTAEGFANRGVAYQQTGKEPLARADYDRAIELNPKFGRAYVLRGLLLLKNGQDAAAWKDLNKGFELDVSLHDEFDPLIKQLRPNL